MPNMNRHDIDDAVRTFEHRHPVLGPAARFLKDYQEGIDSMSDGWPYWSHGTQCTNKLQTLLEREMNRARYPFRKDLHGGGEAPTVAQLQREVAQALALIKGFVTKRKNIGKTAPPLPTLQVHEPGLPLD